MKSKRVVMAVSLAAFFLVILFPLWGLLFPQPQVESLEENRNMTEWSFSGSLKDRIGTLEDYLNDHLAFRQSMISAVLRANLFLGESPHPLVASGFDGWLYYFTGSEDLHRGEGLDEDQLKELCDTQQKTADAFTAAGVDYRLFLAPDKNSVYPGSLPLSHRIRPGVSTVDQMVTALRKNTSVRITDPRGALAFAAENGSQQYYKTDSHWNANGAWTAYQVLVDDLLPDHPAIRRLTEADLVHYEATASGDLAAMIGQKGIMVDRFDCVSLREATAHEDPDRLVDGLTLMVNDTIPEAPRLLFIHDSFGGAIAPYLQESFSEVWLMTNDSATFANIGDLSRFDIVVFEVVERDRSLLWDGIADGEYIEEEYGESEEMSDEEFDAFFAENYEESEGE